LLVAAPALAADEPLFKLVARDGIFTPDVIEAPAGKRVRVEVSNEGKTAMEFESRDLKQEKVIPPGSKATFTINAMKPGEYRFFDEFHEKTGQGKFIVR
jgi:plastocyanin